MHFFCLAEAAAENATHMPTLAIPSVFKLLGSFALLLVVLFLVIWILRKLSGARGGFFHSESGIKVLEKKALSQKTMLYVVEFEGEKILVSESSSHIKIKDLKHEPSE